MKVLETWLEVLSHFVSETNGSINDEELSVFLCQPCLPLPLLGFLEVVRDVGGGRSQETHIPHYFSTSNYFYVYE